MTKTTEIMEATKKLELFEDMIKENGRRGYEYLQ
jgi:hypothetical protein